MSWLFGGGWLRPEMLKDWWFWVLAILVFGIEFWALRPVIWRRTPTDAEVFKAINGPTVGERKKPKR